MAHVHQAVEAAETLAVARATVEAVVAGVLDRAQREKAAAETQLRIELAAAAAQAAQACFSRFLQSIVCLNTPFRSLLWHWTGLSKAGMYCRALNGCLIIR